MRSVRTMVRPPASISRCRPTHQLRCCWPARICEPRHAFAPPEAMATRSNFMQMRLARDAAPWLARAGFASSILADFDVFWRPCANEKSRHLRGVRSWPWTSTAVSGNRLATKSQIIARPPLIGSPIRHLPRAALSSGKMEGRMPKDGGGASVLPSGPSRMPRIRKCIASIDGPASVAAKR
jgi:hypothetical protein